MWVNGIVPFQFPHECRIYMLDAFQHSVRAHTHANARNRNTRETNKLNACLDIDVLFFFFLVSIYSNFIFRNLRKF